MGALGSGESLQLDGIDDWVEFVDRAAFTSYTLACWVKFDALRAQSIIARTDAGGTNSALSHQIRLSAAGHIEHYTYDGALRIVSSPDPLVVDQWYHVAISAEEDGMVRLYLDGVEVGTSVPITTPWQLGDRWQLGTSSLFGFGPFGGKIDDLQIFHRPLEPGEVANLAAGTAP